MSTQPCPRGDGGICKIPERTLVATPGMLEVRSRAQVLAEFPDLELEGPLEPVRDAEMLRDAFRSMGDLGELNRFLRSYADQDSDVARDESKALLVALARLTETKSRQVLVYCEPCGDLFTKRVP